MTPGGSVGGGTKGDSMRQGHLAGVVAVASAVCALIVTPAFAGSADNDGCPTGWDVQSVAGSTAGHDHWDRNGDGLICSKGNETLPGNAGPPNGRGNTHVGSEATDGHNHKDNNNP